MAILFDNAVIKAIFDEISAKLTKVKDRINVDPAKSYFFTLGENRKMLLQDKSESDVHWASAIIITTDIALWEKFIEEFKFWQQHHSADVKMLNDYDLDT